MNETFVFAASCICLLVGFGLCFLPAKRYFRSASIGTAGGLFLVCGIVLMTTFKWTEVAIKISDLEVKLSKAQQDISEANASLALVRQSITPEATNETLSTVLATYKNVSNSEPTEAQVADFKAALSAAKVTVVPVEAFSGVERNYMHFEVPK